ncbi:oxygenase MpaB family protein [Curvibacter lanceolatus]|uniref:oxygenase MpaB family protein n=1 Tax=Curvibacter lanceolatus TaxID=86182 RepID=UPI00036877FF|nr:oxygenase MpaB family protein [Curvibacter lanceolatus]
MQTWSNEALDALRYAGDPLADATVARLMHDWVRPQAGHSLEQLQQLNQAPLERLNAATRLLHQMPVNGGLADWRPQPPPAHPDLAGILIDYVHQALQGYAWETDPQVDQAEKVFAELGVLSCLIQFCASLPECYVVPDLSDVLHVAGQLEQHTDHRIRATAAMIFPVMLPGGLTSASGRGVGQVLKVRLIHATIRHLILRGEPQVVLESVRRAAGTPQGMVPPLSSATPVQGLQASLLSHGWDLHQHGMPCNQEELGYTLLTFSFVFLRSLRRLGLGLQPEQETAYLHCWNRAARLLGVSEAMLASDYGSAAQLFALIQQRARAGRPMPDVRPLLGQALVANLESVVPLRVLKPVGPLMIHHLCGQEVADEIGVRTPAGGLSVFLFNAGMALTRGLDALVRVFVPGFSLARFFTRLIGQQYVWAFLLSQTRPLVLPTELLGEVHATLHTWSVDPKAPRWLNAIERYVHGPRLTSPPGAPQP